MRACVRAFVRACVRLRVCVRQGPDYEEYPEGKYEGQGVVMCAGGRLQIVNAYSVVRALRKFGCELPVQMYYAGPSEMSAEAVQVFNDLDVTVLDIYHSLEGADAELPLRGFQIKAFAVLHSSFEQVLWLDSDAVPATNVTHVFSSETFNKHGSLFWQDWSRDPHWLTPQFMAAYGLHMHVGERELEAGQFVLWKRRTWHALQLVLYMNRNFPHFYRRLYGDKDTWRLAFKLAKTKMGLVSHAADVLGAYDATGSLCGNTMLHKDEAGDPFTLHRTLQTLPGVCTPLPPTLRALSNQHLSEACDPVRAGLWAWRSRGGLQIIVPRLNESSAGWRVDKLETAETNVAGHKHWCLYFNGDKLVKILPTDTALGELESSLRSYVRDLAALDIMDSLSESVVT